MATIKIEKVRKCFGEVEVLKEFNQVFNDGEFVTLLGPSGCGKAVLAIRPESIHLRRDAGVLKGVLDSKVFMGDITDCFVRLPNGKNVRVIAPPEAYDEYNARDEVYLDFDSFHVYEDDGTGDATKIVT